MRPNRPNLRTTLAAVLALPLALSVAGCYTRGTASLRKETEASVAQKITEGKTTKEEVKTMFGPAPAIAITEDGLERWQFVFGKRSLKPATFIPYVGSVLGGWNGTINKLVIDFDEKGVVKRRTMSDWLNE